MAWEVCLSRVCKLNPTMLACALAFAATAAAAAPSAVVKVRAPRELEGIHPGLLGSFSAALPSETLSFRLWAPQDDPEGCAPPTTDLLQGDARVAVVRRGSCMFLKKTLNAQQAGAQGVIIVSDSEEITVMGGSNDTAEDALVKIFAINVKESFGDQVLAWLKGKEKDRPIIVSLQVYTPRMMDISEALLVCLATALVAAGAFFSTADLRHGSPIAPRKDEVVEVRNEMAAGFCVLGSIMLMVFYCFMNYMIYFIMFSFCLGGASCMVQFGSACLQHLVPSLRQRAANVLCLGPIAIADMICTVPAVILVTCWIVFRNTSKGWMFQDIIGAGFLCWLQRTLRLPNIKTATLLLSAMFFFDIFWVFISPLLFRKSVMVAVATGGDTGEAVPMLLRIPSVSDPFGRDRMLGFGDIALPGLLVSLLRRHDVLSKRRFIEGYFLPALVGYFFGLCVTIVALMLMQMGQPALLYLVPGTLGTTLLLAIWRNEFRLIWEDETSGGGAGGSKVACPADKVGVPEEEIPCNRQ